MAYFVIAKNTSRSAEREARADSARYESLDAAVAEVLAEGDQAVENLDDTAAWIYEAPADDDFETPLDHPSLLIAFVFRVEEPADPEVQKRIADEIAWAKANWKEGLVAAQAHDFADAALRAIENADFESALGWLGHASTLDEINNCSHYGQAHRELERVLEPEGVA